VRGVGARPHRTRARPMGRPPPRAHGRERRGHDRLTDPRVAVVRRRPASRSHRHGRRTGDRRGAGTVTAPAQPEHAATEAPQMPEHWDVELDAPSYFPEDGEYHEAVV